MNFPRIYSDFDIDLPFFSCFSSENLPLIHEKAQWFPIYLPLNTIDLPVLSLTSSTHFPVICHLDPRDVSSGQWFSDLSAGDCLPA